MNEKEKINTNKTINRERNSKQNIIIKIQRRRYIESNTDPHTLPIISRPEETNRKGRKGKKGKGKKGGNDGARNGLNGRHRHQQWPPRLVVTWRAGRYGNQTGAPSLSLSICLVRPCLCFPFICFPFQTVFSFFFSIFLSLSFNFFFSSSGLFTICLFLFL